MEKNFSPESSKVVEVGSITDKDSWKAMATKIYSDVMDFVDKEGRLIRAEMNEKVKHVKVATFSLMISGLILFIGAQCFAALAIVLLSHIMPLWLSLISVSASFFTVGGLLYARARSKLKTNDLKPKKSMEALDHIRFSLQEKVDEISRH